MTPRAWKDVRAEAVSKGGITDASIATERLELERDIAVFRLSETRKALGLTQREVAEAMHVAQPRVSAIEHGRIANTEVATLRAYVQALGGELHLVAEFADTTVALS